MSKDKKKKHEEKACGCMENKECTCGDNCECGEECSCHEESNINDERELLIKRIKDLEDALLRSQAELINYKKRKDEETDRIILQIL